MAFRPNIAATIQRKLPKRDIHGRESFDIPQPVMIAIVRLGDKVEESSVRADSSASRGSAEQATLQAKLLIGPAVKVSSGDVISVQGRLIEIEGVADRMDLFGKLDHRELLGNLKGDM